MFRLALLIAGAVVASCAAPAVAADAVAPGWIDWLKPWFDLLSQTIIAAVLTLVAAGAKRWLGVELEARHRQALHSALTTGAAAAWDKLKGWREAGLPPERLRDELVAETIAHARGGAGEALAAFALDDLDPRLRRLAVAKLKETAPWAAPVFTDDRQPTSV